MPETFSIADFNFLLFVIPGFMIVWSYRYSIYSKKSGDFELLGLSFFWGIALVALYTYFAKDKSVQALSNPYAACLGLSFIGSFFAFVISSIKEKNRIVDAGRWLRIAGKELLKRTLGHGHR